MKMAAGWGLLAVVLFMWVIFSPPRFWLNWTKPVSLADPVRAGAQVVERYDCRSCHRIAGRGSLKSTGLDDAARRLDKDTLRMWLLNPRAVDKYTTMPNFRLSDNEITAVTAYFESL